MKLEIEHRHSDYGPDAGGYSVLRFNGKLIGRVETENRATAEELTAGFACLQKLGKCQHCDKGPTGHLCGGLLSSCYSSAMVKSVEGLLAENDRLKTELASLKMRVMVAYGCDTPEVAFDEIEEIVKEYFPRPVAHPVPPG